MSNIRTSRAVESKFHVHKHHAVLGAISLALLGANQVQAEPSANGAIHAVTGMAHANYHATKNCGAGVLAMTPQPGTDLMPIDESSIPPDIAFPSGVITSVYGGSDFYVYYNK